MNNFRIPHYIFSEAANEIENFFEKESSKTYFIPYVPKTEVSPKILPKGKLWSKYVNTKSSLKKIYHHQTSEKPSTSGSGANKTLDDDIKEQLAGIEFLTKNITPWADVCIWWRKTFNSRQKELENLKESQSYFNKFRALKQQDGYELLLMDFEVTHSDAVHRLYKKWPKLKAALQHINTSKDIKSGMLYSSFIKVQ